LGSAACDFLGLAIGECNAFVAFNLAEWDTAGGHAITLAAGGAVRQLTHSTGLHVLIAGPAKLVEELEDIVSSSGNV
jgi:fructose-1,6-bisphosphatase/inositol monophosphatase family enzyme